MFCYVFFIHFLAATNDRKHVVSPHKHIKLRPHFIYSVLLMMIQFELYTLTDYASHVSHQNM
jgi:hypothetical protein